MQNHPQTTEPLVSVLMPTFNRPKYLSQALASALNQTYENLQIIVVNDGGQDVTDIINASNDPRIIFLNRKQNYGKAFSLNQALAEAEGKYIAYLDDDDLYYPNHIELLVNALEKNPDCGAAYSDLYKTYCRILPDGTREILSKIVEVSRDFDRYFMLYYNHVLHVSLMHRKDLLEKTGPYNENLNILIDWDMTRKLVFFTDFYHIPDITGEFYSSIGQSDRISYQQRRDKKNYANNVLTIRTTRPPKPWPKIKDLAIIFISGLFDQQAAKTIGRIWRYTFHPYKIYLPITPEDIAKIRTDMPNLIFVPVAPSADTSHKIDAALMQADAEFVAIVPSDFPVKEMWLEDQLYALLDSSDQMHAIEFDSSTDQLLAAVFKKEHLYYARKNFNHLPFRQSLSAAGIRIQKLLPEQIPFKFDALLEEATTEYKNGNWPLAAEIYQHIADNYKNQLWMKSLAADALFRAGRYEKASQLCRRVNQSRPTVDTLLLEAKLKKKQKDFLTAVELLENAQAILEGKNLVWT
jgi:glycosyltransferase involved in cell wall biosynthesis